nr:hypothetical protein [Angustibacter aerolatus]
MPEPVERRSAGNQARGRCAGPGAGGLGRAARHGGAPGSWPSPAARAGRSASRSRWP